MKATIKSGLLLFLFFLGGIHFESIQAQVVELVDPSFPGSLGTGKWYGKIGAKTNVINGINLTSSDLVLNGTEDIYSGASVHCPKFDLASPQKTKARFKIMDPGMEPSLGTHDVNVLCGLLPFIPPGSGLNRSVRIGNICGDGEGEGLFMDFLVTPANSLLTLYYSMVLEFINDAAHTDKESPEFIIEVVDKITGRPIDPCARLRISSYRADLSDNWEVCSGSTPACSNWDGCIAYMPWRKVVLNLTPYIGNTVILAVKTGDCSYTAHYGYGYLAGTSGPISLTAENCAIGETDTVATVSAPDGLLYDWYFGEINKPTEWVQVPSNRNGDSILAILEEDFDMYAPDGYQLTVVCNVGSKMNPDIPCISPIEIKVRNNKPRIIFSDTNLCELKMRFVNNSILMDPTDRIDTSLTVWEIEENGAIIATITNSHDSIEYVFQSSGEKNIYITEISENGGCKNRKARKVFVMDTIDLRILEDELYCIEDKAVFTGSGADRYEWRIGSATYTGTSISHVLAENDTVVYLKGYVAHCSREIEKKLSIKPYPKIYFHGDTIICEGSITPLKMIVTNTLVKKYSWSESSTGLPEISSTELYRAMPKKPTTYYARVVSENGCEANDSIMVYVVSPKITVDTLEICPGGKVQIIASDRHATQFSWGVHDPIASGNKHEIISDSPMETTVYSVTASYKSCTSHPPKTVKIEVYPFPIPSIQTQPGFIDIEEPISVFMDDSKYGETSFWTLEDGYTTDSRHFSHQFDTALLSKMPNITIDLISFNKLKCASTTSISIPVKLFVAKFPNAFTPDAASNNIFNIGTINLFSKYHLYIYNRHGELVFDSTDQTIGWDGKSKGKPCPVGSYVWVVEFQRQEKDRTYTQKGNVMLIR